MLHDVRAMCRWYMGFSPIHLADNKDASAEAKVEKPDDHSKNEQEAVQMIKIADEEGDPYQPTSCSAKRMGSSNPGG
eukprot:161207-Amphidinium_carterae.2